jgi:hypothetical protein
MLAAVPPPPAANPPPSGNAPHEGPERRRHRRGLLSRLLTRPLSATAMEDRARVVTRPVTRIFWVLVPALCIAAFGYAAVDAWSRRTPLLEPRHRAEALCFELAVPPRFAPPMPVEPSAALVRGRFAPGTPATLALREVMHYQDDMVISEHTSHVGDFDVTTAWLRLPGSGDARHWLIVGWMEGADLAICNFRFSGDATDLSPDEAVWGSKLLERILTPDNFQSGTLPPVRLRANIDDPLPTFGPKRRS